MTPKPPIVEQSLVDVQKDRDFAITVDPSLIDVRNMQFQENENEEEAGVESSDLTVFNIKDGVQLDYF